MFDVSFGELVLIGIVALLVIGPERLPKVARAAGFWVGRARRFAATVKADIEQEIKAEELRQLMAEQAKSTGIHEIIEETKDSLKETKDSLKETKDTLKETKENLEAATKQDYLIKATPPTEPSPARESQQQPSPSGVEHDHKA